MPCPAIAECDRLAETLSGNTVNESTLGQETHDKQEQPEEYRRKHERKHGFQIEPERHHICQITEITDTFEIEMTREITPIGESPHPVEHAGIVRTRNEEAEQPEKLILPGVLE